MQGFSTIPHRKRYRDQKGYNMARTRLYLDWNATSPLLPAARQALVDALDVIGNPSSIHAEGRRARALVENARVRVAALAGVAAGNVIFTSGGTEAANLALSPMLVRTHEKPCDLLFVSAGEHACVLDGSRFPASCVRIVPLNAEGIVDLGALNAMLDESGEARVMLALQAANNETGAIQPVREAAALVHARGGVVVCDAVQAAGRIDCRVDTLDADAIFFSAHKIGGPKGVGALALRASDPNMQMRLIRGGGQERNLRAGTENVSGAAAFGVAAEWAQRERDVEARNLAALRDAMEERLLSALPDLTIFSRGVPRLANTSAFAIAGAPASTLLIGLDLEGVAVSSGSACSSGKVKESHVLAAMGVAPDISLGVIRVSLGRDTTAEDVSGFVDAYVRVASRIAQRRKAAA
ncbi:MAG: cysteine desulfurase family protein [Beijerinckiaceae bacterium]|nr:cysteine desulfurase family protein [Beijerinckiaceae bacterium]